MLTKIAHVGVKICWENLDVNDHRDCDDIQNM